MTARDALIARLELALNEALLGRGITVAHVQRNYRLNHADASRFMALRSAAFDALAALAAPPPAPTSDMVPAAEAWCDVCTGTGTLLTGHRCDLCRGTGKASEALIGLRVLLEAAERSRDEAWQRVAAPPPAPPADLVALREAWEAGFRLAVHYGDNAHHWEGQQRETQWRAFLLSRRLTPTPDRSDR